MRQKTQLYINQLQSMSLNLKLLYNGTITQTYDSMH